MAKREAMLMLSIAAALAFDGAPLEKAQAIWQIETLRLPAAALESFLTDPDPAVRRRAVRALGNLRETAKPLAPLLADGNADVRREAAFAAGLVTETASMVAARWKVEPEPAVRAALAVALGRQGGADELRILTVALDGPDRAAAAEAIGRMGLRKVDGVTSDAVVAGLLAVTRGPLGPARRNAAWALSRMGLTTTSVENAAAMRRLALGDHDPDVRAWLVRAVIAVGADESFLAAAAKDRESEVRVAAARGIAKGPCPADTALAMLRDSDAGVRIEAIAAIGTCKSADVAALREVLASGSEWERAAAVRALAARKALPEPVLAYTAEPWPLAVRVAAVESMEDRKKLMGWALKSPEAHLRSAAAGKLLDGDAPRPAEVVDLLGASDAIVAQAAADTVKEHPDPGAQATLVELLRRKELPRLVGLSAVRALDAIYATGRLPRPGPEVGVALRPWLGHPEVREEAARLAGILQVPLPRGRHPQVRLPSLAEVAEVRSARVFTSRGEVRVELFPEVAPLTVWNFASLAEAHYFDGLVFHRVVPGFVIQSGDPRGDGWGGPGYEIPDEINDVRYGAGTVGMALSGPDTGGSQWFVTLGPQPHLDGTYTVFGRVTYGMAAAQGIGVGDAIERVEIERVRR